MRSRQTSLAALVAAAASVAGLALTSSAGLASDQAAGPQATSAAINWPPQLPAFGAETAATATREEPKPAAAAPPAEPQRAPAAVVEVPPPAITVPPTAPVIEPTKAQTFALAAEISQRLKADRATERGARADRDAAARVYEERKGEPIWVAADGLTPKAFALMNAIKDADNWGLQASAFRLPTPPAQATPEALADAEVTLSLAALKYARFARGDRLDPLSLTKMFDRKPQVFEPASVLVEMAAAGKADNYLKSLHPAHPQFERLRLKYVAVRSGQSVLPPPPAAPAAVTPAAAVPGKVEKAGTAQKKTAAPTPLSNAALERKLLANMEMWRWMPELGTTYVQNNIPEFTTKFVRDGKVIHVERIVTGKADTPTPIFSDQFETVVFKPFWNVPESIKWKELQPQLARNPGALSKAGLRAAYNGKEVDPASIDWNATDLRSFHVFQPPGTGNALGQVKFLFPNKHDVYMHDTPHKALFENAARAYSHGCMRVRHPLKFAELLLGPDKGMDAVTIHRLANAGPENNEIKLTKRIPIHITYFTAMVDDEGTLKLLNDVYNHEQKVHLGLEGKAHLIVQPRIEAEKAPPRVSGVSVRQQKSSDPVGDWIKSVFQF